MNCGPLTGREVSASQHQIILTSPLASGTFKHMRTTLKIDDDIYRAARSIAAEHGKTIGDVISALARRGLRPAIPMQSRKGFPVFDVSPEAAPLTPEMVRQAVEDSG